MKSLVTIFPDEIVELINQARFAEKRNSVGEFIREAVKTYLRNTGYDIPEVTEVIKRGPEKGWQKGSGVTHETLNNAIETYVAPTQPTPAWGDIKGWNEN